MSEEVRADKPESKLMVIKTEPKLQDNGQYREWQFFQCEVREVERTDGGWLDFKDYKKIQTTNVRVFVEVKK